MPFSLSVSSRNKWAPHVIQGPLVYLGLIFLLRDLTDEEPRGSLPTRLLFLCQCCAPCCLGTRLMRRTQTCTVTALARAGLLQHRLPPCRAKLPCRCSARDGRDPKSREYSSSRTDPTQLTSQPNTSLGGINSSHPRSSPQPNTC